MWRKLVVSTLVALLALLSAGFGVGLAADSTPNEALHLVGQARVAGSQRRPQLVLSADAADGSGWHLDVALVPAFDQRRRSAGIPLVGEFTLTGPGSATATGQALGQLSQDGTGSLQLADDQGSTQLTAGFVVDEDGQLQLDLTGQLPEPVPAPSTSAAATGSDQPASHAFWYVARAAGLTAYLVLFANMVLGLAVRTRFLDDILARWRAFDLHQFTALLALAFLALHVFALLGDQYVHFSLAQLFVPFAAAYRPAWVALGVVALYVLVVVTASFYVRDRLGYRAWRALHYLSFGAYVLALAHGIFSGTDSSQLWAKLLYWSTGLVVALLTAWRFLDSGSSAPARASSKTLTGTPNYPPGPSRRDSR